MNNVKTSLLNKLGRIIEKMPRSEYFMMVAIMALPLGVLLYIENEDMKLLGILLVFIAIFAWGLGIISIQKEEKQRQADRKVTNNLISHAENLIVTMIDELKGLREDVKELPDKIGKDKNEHN